MDFIAHETYCSATYLKGINFIFFQKMHSKTFAVEMNTDEHGEKIDKTVLENRLGSLWKAASNLDIHYGSAQQIVVDILGLNLLQRLVPKNLIFFLNTLEDRRVDAEMISEIPMKTPKT